MPKPLSSSSSSSSSSDDDIIMHKPIDEEEASDSKEFIKSTNDISNPEKYSFNIYFFLVY